VRRSKYGNVPTTVNGVKLDSKAEARRYQELLLLQRAGQITGLLVHPEFELQPAFESRGKAYRPIIYEGDFEYIEDFVVVEDVKAVQTAEFKLKAKMFRYHYPHIDFRIVDVKR
jgi:hypothetical protein